MVGMEFDFEVQLVLKKDEVPACQLTRDAPVGPRLGWTTWLCTAPPAADVEDVAFDGENLVWLNGAPAETILS